MSIPNLLEVAHHTAEQIFVSDQPDNEAAAAPFVEGSVAIAAIPLAERNVADAADAAEPASLSIVPFKQPKKKGEGAQDWHYSELVLTEEHFRDFCCLPGDGADPFKDQSVSMVDLEADFGPKHKSCGFKLPGVDSAVYPHAMILLLSKIIDGHHEDRGPVNGRMTASFARGLYLEYRLKKKVNWAKVAHDKHMNQVRNGAWMKKLPKPTEPPYVRDPRKWVIVEPSAVAKVVTEVPVTEAVDTPKTGSIWDTEAELKAMGLDSQPLSFSEPVYRPDSYPVASSTALPSQRPDLQFEKQLRAAIDSKLADLQLMLGRHAIHIDELEKIALKVTIDILQAEKEKAELLRVALQRKETTDAAHKKMEDLLEHNKAIALELEAAGEGLEDDADPDDPVQGAALCTIAHLEDEQAKLGLAIGSQRSIIDLEAIFDDSSPTAVEKLTLNSNYLKLQQDQFRIDIQSAKDNQAGRESIIQSCLALRESLNSTIVFEESNTNVSTFVPMSIPTSIHVGPTVHKITSCPKCCLGYHCRNWVPTPCGHSYHPRCLFSILESPTEDGPCCLACNAIFHPDWLLCWGYKNEHPGVSSLQKDLNCDKQRELMFEELTRYYSEGHVMEHRAVEGEKQQKQTIPWTEYKLDLSMNGEVPLSHLKFAFVPASTHMFKETPTGVTAAFGPPDATPRTSITNVEKTKSVHEKFLLETAAQSSLTVRQSGRESNSPSLVSSPVSNQQGSKSGAKRKVEVTSITRRQSLRTKVTPVQGASARSVAETTDESPSDSKPLKSMALGKVSTPANRKTGAAKSAAKGLQFKSA